MQKYINTIEIISLELMIIYDRMVFVQRYIQPRTNY